MENSERDGNIKPCYLPLKKSVCGSRSNSWNETLGKVYVKGVYCHPAYLTSMQSTSCEMGKVFQIGKSVCQGCILSPCLFNLYADYFMRNPGLEEAQAEIKTARRNTSNLIYADDATLTAESQEDLNSLLMKVKEESEKVGLKLSIPNT